MRSAWPLLLLAAACGADDSAPGRLRATVVRPLNDTTRDTIRFDVPAVAHHCAGGVGVVLSGARTGNGVLVVVRPGAEPLAGRFAVVPRGDTTSPGALVAVRTLVSDVARGVGLDSGEVAISVASGRMSATAAGAGVGVPGAVRLTVDAAFEDVPAPRDSVPCDAAR